MGQGDPLCSARLLELARGGEDWALEELFDRYVGPLRRWAHGRLPKWARGVVDTDDLVQDSLLGSLRNLGRFNASHPAALHAYLRTAVRNRITDELRRAATRPDNAVLGHDAADYQLSPLETTIGKETFAAFEYALSQLPKDKQEAIIARVELGMTYEQIAIALGKPSADAARMVVRRAIAQLATGMARRQNSCRRG